jgi:hypothetical protein
MESPRSILLFSKSPPWSSQSHSQVTFPHQFQSKTWQRPSTTNPTIHDRERGYSNSFTLCRGCTLYPHHLTTHRVGTSQHNDVCHDKQPINNVSSARLSINTTTKRCVPQHQRPIGCPGCAKSPAACHYGMILTLVESYSRQSNIQWGLFGVYPNRLNRRMVNLGYPNLGTLVMESMVELPLHL